jgi:hypothetical protein
MSAANSHTKSAGFFIAERNVMKFQKVDL